MIFHYHDVHFSSETMLVEYLYFPHMTKSFDWQGYRIYFLHQNFTSVQTIRDNKSAMVETLTRLSKLSVYFITKLLSIELKRFTKITFTSLKKGGDFLLIFKVNYR